MAKRQLNKNVVMGLTVGAMVIVVGAVGATAYSAAQRDPAVYLKRAAEAEQAGEYRRASRQFQRAYNAGKDALHLVDAARCEYQLGEFMNCIGLLRYAHAQMPQDPRVLVALLERMWEMRTMGVAPRPIVQNIREYAEKLVKLEPDNVLGLISLADSIDLLGEQDSASIDMADKAVTRAMELEPDSPRVALIRSSIFARREITKALESTGRVQNAAFLDKLKKVRAGAAEILREAMKTNKTEPRLATTLADVLQANGQPEEAIRVLEQAARDMPASEDVHHTLAQFLLSFAGSEKSTLPPEEKVAYFERAIAHADRAIALDPAMYPSYSVKADALRLRCMAQGVWDSERAERQKEILDIFVKAQAESVGRKSLRARLGENLRAIMLGVAFDLSLLFQQTAPDQATGEQAMQYVRRFQTDLQTQFKDWAKRFIADGQVALLDRDTAVAIRSFKRAEERAAGEPNLLRYAREQLANLYFNESPGLAMKYVDEAAVSYEAAGLEVPRNLLWQKCALLLTLERPKDALDILDRVASKRYPDDGDFRNLRARALAMTGAGKDAIESLSQAAPDDALALLERGRIAANEKDYDTAEESLSRALELRPDDRRIIQLYTQAMLQGERAEKAAAFLETVAPRVSDAGSKLVLDACRVLLTNKDPEQRDRAMLDVIAKTSDPAERAGEYMNFWWSRQNWDKVEEHLNELARIRGDDAPEVLLSRFNLALRTNRLEDADKAAAALAAKNLDRAGGSTFRGDVKIARNDLAGALAEFRNAERELPGDVSVKLKIAEVLMRHDPPRLQEAVPALMQAVEFNPRNFDANKLLFACLEELGRREEGFPYLERAFGLNNRDAYVRERMRLLDEERDPRKGIEWRVARRKEKPNDLNNLARLVELYEKVGEREKAEQALREALAASEKVPMSLAAMTARFYGAAKQRAEGEAFLRQYIADSPGAEKLDAMLLLGRFYEHLEDPAAALTAYLDTERRIDELTADDAEARRRARLVVATAKAEFYGRMMQFAQMAEEYKTALANLGPDMGSYAVDLRMKLVKGLLANNQLAEAEAEITRFTAENPRDVRGMQLRAELVLRRSMTDAAMDEARGLLTKVLAEQPNNVFALFLRGRLGMSQRRYEEARADLMRCKQVDPTAYQFEPRVELARLYETTAQTTLAEAELRELVDASPDPQKFVLKLVDFFVRTEQYAKAQAVVSERIARAPEDWYWHHQLGKLQMRRGQNEAAIQPLRKAFDLSKGANAEVAADWLNAMQLSGRANDAVAALSQLNPSVVTSQVLRASAEAFLRLGAKERARQQFDKALATAAARMVDEAGEVVDHVMRTLGVEEAIAGIRRTIDAVGSDHATNLRLRIVLARALILGQDANLRTEGVKLADEVLAQAPPRSRLAVSALLVRALGLEASGDAEAAVKAYEQALAIQPDAVQALNNIAYLLADRLNQPRQALPYAEQAVRLVPANSDIQDTLGWIFFLTGDNGQAETSLLEAIRLNPANLAASYHLGQVYEKIGRVSDARKQYERVIERCKIEKNSPYCAQAQQALAKLN